MQTHKETGVLIPTRNDSLSVIVGDISACCCLLTLILCLISSSPPLILWASCALRRRRVFLVLFLRRFNYFLLFFYIYFFLKKRETGYRKESETGEKWRTFSVYNRLLFVWRMKRRRMFISPSPTMHIHHKTVNNLALSQGHRASSPHIVEWWQVPVSA